MDWFWKKKSKQPLGAAPSPPTPDQSSPKPDPPAADPNPPVRPKRPSSGPDHSPPGPDYAWIDSREKAEALVESGELVALLMAPEDFGGEPRPENIVYAPQFAAEMKESIEQDVIRPIVLSGKVVEYSVTPEYAGGCFVPIALRLMFHDSVDAKYYEIRIWGEALRRPQP